METAATSRPEVFLIDCYKCCRQCEIHGEREKLELCLTAEGWVNEGGRMVCPHCPAPREPRQFNHTRERRGGMSYTSRVSEVG